MCLGVGTVQSEGRILLVMRDGYSEIAITALWIAVSPCYCSGL